MPRSTRQRRNRFRPRTELLEFRRLLACTAVGDTQVECFSSEGNGTPEAVWFRDLADGHEIEGYTSEASVAPGDTLELHVSTAPAQNYRVEIYRLGWYAGDGARRVACLPDCSSGELVGSDQGIPTPDPVTLEVAASWPVSDAFTIPNDWQSGYYIASLILTSGPKAGEAHFVPFIVKAEAQRNADILVEVPVNTWQAYNSWGGHSLYDPQAADKVSFDRPYDNIEDVFRYEYQMLRYLEREGFDVEYATNVDVHREPEMLLDHELVISTGHDEYWTSEMRSAFDDARDAGVDLGFFTSNAAYWQVRYEQSERTLVGYKVKPENAADDPEPDPAKKSMKFRDLTPPRPECELIGVQYMATHTPGFTTDEDKHEDYAVNPAALNDPWFAGTGIDATSVFAHRVGYEWDQIVPGCHATQPEVLFNYATNNGDDAHATKYTTALGATVFSTGSMGFSFGLDSWRFSGTAVEPADTRLQTFVRNVLTDLAGGGPKYEQSQDGNGIVEFEAENFHAHYPQSGHAWSNVAETAASAGNGMFAGPDIGANESNNYETTSPRLDFNIDFTETGTHYVWILGRAGGSTPETSDSLHAGLDGVGPLSAKRIQNFTDQYGWSSKISGGSRTTLDVPAAGLHTFNLWMREDGFIVDKVVLTTNPTLDIHALLSPPASFEQGTDGNGLVLIEAEQFDDNRLVGTKSWTAVAEAAASGGTAMFAGPDTGANINTDYAVNSPRLNYNINFIETGTHYLWVLGRAGGSSVASSDSLHAGIDGNEVATAFRVQNFDADYGWSSAISSGDRATLEIPSAGVHTLNIWMREDGFIVDRIVLTTNPTLDINSLLNPPSPTPSFIQSSEGDGLVDIEAEQFDATTANSGHSWTTTDETAASGGQAMIAGPETGANISSNYAANSPRLDYHIEFVETGTHYLWILGRAAGSTVGSSDSLHAGLDGAELAGLQRIQGFDGDFGWSNSINGGARATFSIDSVGVHTLNLWMREDAFTVDRIVVTTNPTTNIETLLNPPQPTASFVQSSAGDGLVDIEAELFDVSIANGGKSWSAVIEAAASSGQAMIAGPETGANNSSNYAATSPRLDYGIEFVETGLHYVWILGRAAGTTVASSDSVHAGFDGADLPSLQRFQSYTADYTWSGTLSTHERATFDVVASGIHTLNIWMREDAFIIDRILVTTNPTTDIASLLNPPAQAGFASAAVPADDAAASPSNAADSSVAAPLPDDVNNDGFVTPLDALLIINRLNAGVESARLDASNAFSRLDTNRDGFVTPLDVLRIVNRLNAARQAETGEGEMSIDLELLKRSSRGLHADAAIQLMFS